jgi:hypothetical protein
MKVSELVGKRVYVSGSEGFSIDGVIFAIRKTEATLFAPIEIQIRAVSELAYSKIGDCYLIPVQYNLFAEVPNQYLKVSPLENAQIYKTKNCFTLNNRSDKYFEATLKSISFDKEDFAEYFATKEAEEREKEEGLWFESKMRGFTVDFYKPLTEMQEELKSYYLAAVKDIVEKKKEMISNDTIKDAIKNGLVVKYPELKKVLVKEKDLTKEEKSELVINEIFKRIRSKKLTSEDISPNMVNQIAGELGVELTSAQVVFISDNY